MLFHNLLIFLSDEIFIPVKSFLLCSYFSFAQLTAKVYEDPNIERIVANHKTIAILPMDVTVRDVKAKEKNRLSPEEIEKMEEVYRSGFQNSMYSWFLKMKKKGRLTQKVQDVRTTNSILQKNGIESEEDLMNYNFEELADMLEVDGIFHGSIITTRSFSQGGAVAIALITGFGVRTGDADVIVKLYDGKTSDMIWSFDRTVASSYASNPEDIADYLMKRVSKRFPYKR